MDNKVLEIFREITLDPAAIKKYLKNNLRIPQDTTNSLRESISRCQQKIEKLTATLALNSDSSAAKYIVGEIEKLDAEYNSLRKKLLNANAQDRKAAIEQKNAMKKREQIIQLIEHFDEFTPNERNEIAISVIKECRWDGETLFITL